MLKNLINWSIYNVAHHLPQFYYEIHLSDVLA